MKTLRLYALCGVRFLLFPYVYIQVAAVSKQFRQWATDCTGVLLSGAQQEASESMNRLIKQFMRRHGSNNKAQSEEPYVTLQQLFHSMTMTMEVAFQNGWVDLESSYEPLKASRNELMKCWYEFPELFREVLDALMQWPLFDDNGKVNKCVPAVVKPQTTSDSDKHELMQYMEELQSDEVEHDKVIFEGQSVQEIDGDLLDTVFDKMASTITSKLHDCGSNKRASKRFSMMSDRDDSMRDESSRSRFHKSFA